MQPLFTSEVTPVVNERQAHPRQTAPGTSARRQTTPTRHSTPDLPQASEDLLQPGTNVEEMMRSIMSEEMRTLEAQMQQRFTSQIHKATTSTPGFDDLARGVRETPITSRITNTFTLQKDSIIYLSKIVSFGILWPATMRERHFMLLAWMSHPPSLVPLASQG
ncbi:hypothetical protein TIFTF001_022657 [Ficus carica]|uniref:Uncharacterized protein n=1 Tax=Ficus carica TaxID=3494 RepID=A0AA88AW31_FICCA|nr:hypothetical protein TIFTF001_022657 [Ficus carica]